MKTAAAVAAIAMASAAAAQGVCSVTCFQRVIAEHPPLDCTEENMYLCFCKDSALQNWYLECAQSECPDSVQGVINFGVTTCRSYGITITPPDLSEPEETTSAAPEPEPTTEAPPPAEETTEAETQPEVTTEAPVAEETTEASAPPAQETTAPVVPSGQTTVVVPTSAADAATSSAASATPTVVEVNMGVSNAASNVLVAAGAFVAALQML